MTIIQSLGTQSIILYELYFTYSFLTYKNHFSLIMVISILTNVILNIFLKKYILEWGSKHNHYIPIIGSLCRPIDTKCDKIDKVGYGTPSNHSQIASFVAAFYYFYYRNTEHYSNSTFILLSILSLTIMTTRYTLNMHSIPQIILGSTLGISLAYVLNKIIGVFL